jgi:hypothetical protein
MTTEPNTSPALPSAIRSERMRYLLPAVLSSFFTLLALVPVGYSLSRNLAPHVATVDLQRLVEEERQRMVAAFSTDTPPTDAQRARAEQMTVEFAKSLSATIDALGAECGCVIVNKAALLGGVTIDYTDQVRAMMKR